MEFMHGVGAARPSPRTARCSRVQPLVLLLSAECGAGAGARSVSLATVVELIHAASLVHDGVLDDGIREGRAPAGRVKSANQTAVLLGDYLLATAFSALGADGNMAFLSDLMSVVAQMCEGQVNLLRSRGSFIAAPDYLDILRMRAGSLTAFCAKAGMLTADGSREWADALGRFGERFGVAFHIAEEILDLVGDDSDGSATGRVFGPDRWFVFPLVQTAQAGSAERATLAAIAEKGEYSPKDLSVVRRLAEDTGALSRCWEIVHSWLDDALEHLELLPETEARTLLARTATDLCGVQQRGPTEHVRSPAG
jgi:octaprenyl-diphosphate synthase